MSQLTNVVCFTTLHINVPYEDAENMDCRDFGATNVQREQGQQKLGFFLIRLTQG